MLDYVESYSGRNKSEININVCYSWLDTSSTNISAAACLVVDNPSGYLIEEFDAISVIKRKPELNIVDVFSTFDRTTWYLSGVTNDTKCFNYTVIKCLFFTCPQTLDPI